MDWSLLPPATDSMIQDVSKAAKSRFIGDPSYVYEYHEKKPEQEDEAVENEAAVSMITTELSHYTPKCYSILWYCVRARFSVKVDRFNPSIY